MDRGRFATVRLKPLGATWKSIVKLHFRLCLHFRLSLRPHRTARRQSICSLVVLGTSEAESRIWISMLALLRHNGSHGERPSCNLTSVLETVRLYASWMAKMGRVSGETTSASEGCSTVALLHFPENATYIHSQLKAIGNRRSTAPYAPPQAKAAVSGGLRGLP